jgi:AraC family transcriptional activator of mtrCDE
MDTLSRLLSLFPMHTKIATHCHTEAPWGFDSEARVSGVVPFHMVLDGEAWLDSTEQKLGPGDILIFPKGAPHRIYHDASRTEMLRGSFEFSADHDNVLLAALPEMFVVRSAGRSDVAVLTSLMALLAAESGSKRPGSHAVVSPLSSALFPLLIRAWLDQARTPAGLFAVLAERRLEPALQGMLAEPGNPWSLADMAAACGMSRATFARVFTQTAGTTPAMMLLQTRMAKAVALLLDGDRVASVGIAVGYHSEAAFNRVFKRTFGMAPATYRRSRQQCHNH